MKKRVIFSVKYLGVQITLDLIFSFFAGLVIAGHSLFVDDNFHYEIFLTAPFINFLSTYARYVTLVEILPRFFCYLLLVGGKTFKVWMALVIGLVSYIWVIGLLELRGWDQGESFLFPFEGEGIYVMIIFTVSMIISTLLSPWAINYLGRHKLPRS